jgi:hypothetical protein
MIPTDVDDVVVTAHATHAGRITQEIAGSQLLQPFAACGRPGFHPHAWRQGAFAGIYAKRPHAETSRLTRRATMPPITS